MIAPQIPEEEMGPDLIHPQMTQMTQITEDRTRRRCSNDRVPKLRNKLNLERLENHFGGEVEGWLKKKYPYFDLLKNQNFVTIDRNTIKLTATGYAICDEILKELL